MGCGEPRFGWVNTVFGGWPAFDSERVFGERGFFFSPQFRGKCAINQMAKRGVAKVVYDEFIKTIKKEIPSLHYENLQDVFIKYVSINGSSVITLTDLSLPLSAITRSISITLRRL